MELPLPIALLLNRAELTAELKLRHDLALTAWEMTVRLAVAIAPPADTSRIGNNAALGTWREALASRAVAAPHPALDEARKLFSSAAGVKAPRAGEAVSFAQLTLYLAGYRNRVHGHGAPRSDAYYEAAAAVLIRALLAVFELHLIADPGWELLATGRVQLNEQGLPRARLLRLMGTIPTLAAADAPVSSDVRPHHIYWGRGSELVALAPWLRWQPSDDGSGRVLFFNGSAKKPLYLNAETGRDVHEGELDAVLVSSTLQQLPTLPPELTPHATLPDLAPLPPPSSWPVTAVARATWPAPPPSSRAAPRRLSLAAIAVSCLGLLMVGSASLYACANSLRGKSLTPGVRMAPPVSEAPSAPRTIEERERLYREALSLQKQGKQLDALERMTQAIKLARDPQLSTPSDERRIYEAYQVLLSERCARSKQGWVKMLVAHKGSSLAQLRAVPRRGFDPDAIGVAFGTCVLVDLTRAAPAGSIAGDFLLTDTGEKVGWMHEDLLEPKPPRSP